MGGGEKNFSGAMRCPKCRANMVQVAIDGTEVDRCITCHGIWFDDGELNKLRSRQDAEVLDVGSARVGKMQDEIENYRCPRCAGTMSRMFDPKQTHISFEQCDSCKGVFFDAGEFTDLATVSLSDFFKRFVAEKR